MQLIFNTNVFTYYLAVCFIYSPVYKTRSSEILNSQPVQHLHSEYMDADRHKTVLFACICITLKQQAAAAAGLYNTVKFI